MSNHKLSRRNFLGQASCAAVGSTTFFSTIFNLKSLGAMTSFNSSLNNSGDYKALICLLNSGGMDSFNMLVPRSGTAYTNYANTRSNMALDSSTLLPITPLVSDGNEYGLHPSMVNMQTLFNQGKLAFVNNVGSLIQPITRAEFYNGSVPIPLGLYSHADQVMHWQTGIPQDRVAQGWGGKMADLLNSVNPNQTLSMNISLAGTNVFQTGNFSSEYTVNPREGALGIIGYEGDWVINQMRTAGINQMFNKTYQDIFKNTYAQTVKKSIDGNQMLSAVIENAPTFPVSFINTNPTGYYSLGESFNMIANIIAGRDQLNMNRQIFFVEYGGWDHHDELLNAHATMMTEVDESLHAFNAAMEYLGVSDCVTVFSLSEFSRTLTSNGNGTDHGWGGNAFIMGGAVNGNRLFGTYPDLSLGFGNPLEIGGGVLIPTTSCDAYFAELALWFGVPASDLALLYPNIGNFYAPSSGTNPIGFLNLV